MKKKKTSGVSGTATTSEEVQLAVAHDAGDRKVQRPDPQDVASVAYQRYLGRGGSHGHDFDDWLQAERELSGRKG